MMTGWFRSGLFRRVRRSLGLSVLAGSVILGRPALASPGDVHYTLQFGSPLTDQTYRNAYNADYYSVVTDQRLKKFHAIAIPAPPCTNFEFTRFLTLATNLAQANTSGAQLIYYTKPVGNEDFEKVLLGSSGCSPYGATPPAFMLNVLQQTGLNAVTLDLENLRFPAKINVGPEMLNYFQNLAGTLPASAPLGIANTAYAEKFRTQTGQFFILDSGGHIIGNTILPPSLISQLGTVIWMDFHTMIAETQSRPFIDERLMEVAALTGSHTAIQIGFTCLNGEVNSAGKLDQETMSTAAGEAEIVLMDAFWKAGVRNFNIYVALENINTPQWKKFYDFLHTDSANFPKERTIWPKVYNPEGISWGVGCQQE
jgi:hypothetical protein